MDHIVKLLQVGNVELEISVAVLKKVFKLGPLLVTVMIQFAWGLIFQRDQELYIHFD